MTRQVSLLVLLIFCGQLLRGQSFDLGTYSHLVKSSKEEFISYSKSAGLSISIDSTSNTLSAKTKECVYLKPLGSENNNENYDLMLIVSTLNKENNKLILKNAIENPGKKGTWTDDEYLYMEWDLENPISKDMWYKVIVYKKKK